MTLMTFSLEEEKVRDLLKEVMLELMAERPEIFQDILSEAIEDAGLLVAIAEGESSERVSRSEIEAILAGRA
ncbi:conserved protein of unknown function [Candidatus Promineifilum breve]|uniref:Uncharacterized protein n=1 Tax=Candidatus Promineifilum breve TaxID=1806508 RepID=A0A160T7J4_9CHLR|nr:hypothetical protein [Candidatus Promineifilum breve]CUS06064.1 conserved protein of unknown function [Candidatus Promineifilum breve]